MRRIDRVAGPPSSLALVSDHIEGTRLSDLLRVAEGKRLQLDINAALYLIRQLVPGVALLHENAREVAHGLAALEAGADGWTASRRDGSGVESRMAFSRFTKCPAARCADKASTRISGKVS